MKWYRKAAEQGDADAQYYLGLCYYRGEGIKQNYEDAVKWYRKAADQGNANAQYRLGYCYEHGEGVPLDYEEAVKWYRKAAEQGYGDAQYKLGFCYENTLEYDEAVEWYRKAAEQGNVDSQYSLGYCYEFGTGVTQNLTESVKWYRKAAEQGLADAQYNLGVCYANGKGVTKNSAEAVRWYCKAAYLRHVDAQYNLGICYFNGEGVTQDYTEAVRWFRKAAEQGDVKAQYNLGICYFNGEGVTQDYSEAVKWYRKAAEQGDVKAQYNLGLCYYNGNGITQNKSEAVKWYRKAAKQGNVNAQYDLGVCNYEGEGVAQDYTEAVRWFRKAAEQGNVYAQYNLGVCYHEGEGVRQSYIEAVKWFYKAAEQGNAEAQYSLGFCYEKGNGVPEDFNESVRWYHRAEEQGFSKAANFLGKFYYKRDLYKVDTDGALTRKAETLDNLISVMDDETSTLLICSDLFFTKELGENINPAVQYIVLQNVKSIPEKAFIVFPCLKSIKIYGDNVRCYNAFNNCSQLERINVCGKNFKTFYMTEKFNFQEEKAAKAYVDEKMQQWKVKGEFEKTVVWQERINGSEAVKKEAELYNEFWRDKISSNSLPTLILGTYDIEHEVFPVECVEYENFLIRVPKAEAKSFKDNWKTIKKTCQYVVKDKKLVIGEVRFFSNGKTYIYGIKKNKELDESNSLYASNACSFVPIKNNIQNSDSKEIGVNRSDFFSVFSEEDAKFFADVKMKDWLYRDDFETFDEWRKRITQDRIKDKYEELYSLYCKNVINAQYSEKLNFKLGEYDADGEVFPIYPSRYQQFNLHVPIDKAPLFKKNWDKIKTNYSFFIHDKRVLLEKVVFIMPNKEQYTFKYDYKNLLKKTEEEAEKQLENARKQYPDATILFE